MEPASTISPLAGLIILSAAIICILVLLAKEIQLLLKLAVVTGMLIFIVYFLRQAGLI